MRAMIVAMTAVLATSGCAAAGPARQASAPRPAPGVTASLPASCGNSAPPAAEPFTYNTDVKARDAILTGGGPLDYEQNEASFEDLDAGGLAELFDRRYMDPSFQFNSSPAMWDILQFLCRHPQVRAAGAAARRPDETFGMLIDDIYARHTTAEMRADAEKLCVDAETEYVASFECFWD
jgi:hypothetical protein